MSRRQITPEQLNALFCSPEFIQRVEASAKDPTDIFLEGTDAEVTRWLQEGLATQKRIAEASQPKGAAAQIRPSAGKKWWQVWK